MLFNRSNYKKFAAIGLAAGLLSVAACSSPTVDNGGGSTGESPEVSDSSETFSFTLSSAVAQSHPSGQATTMWIERVAELTDGRVEIEPVWSGALLPGAETLAGVKDGRADIGHTSASWHMSELPYTSIITLPFLNLDGEASTRALNDMYENDEAVRAEYDNQGVKLVSSQPLDVVLIGSNKSYTNISELEKQSIRATGEWVNALSAVGAEPVEVAYAETYEAVQRGVVDGYAINWEAVYDIQLYEVAPVMEDPGIGQVSNMMLIMNDQKWNSLPADIQAAFDQATAEQVDALSNIYYELSQEQCKLMIDDGAQFHKWDQSAADEWKDLAAETIFDNWINGMPDAATGSQVLETFRELSSNYAGTSTWQSGITICMNL